MERRYWVEYGDTSMLRRQSQLKDDVSEWIRENIEYAESIGDFEGAYQMRRVRRALRKAPAHRTDLIVRFAGQAGIQVREDTRK